MVVAASTTPNLKPTPTLRSPSNPRRPPLLLSERENNVVPPHQRRPNSREVSSRYLLSTTSSSSSTSGSSSSTLSNSSYFSLSRRCPSPVPSSLPATPAPNSSISNRPQSVERRRPATPAPMTAAAKLLVSSTRSLSVSFQGESFAVTNSKKNANTAPSPNFLRMSTPERRKNSAAMAEAGASTTPKKGENGRPVDRQPWPGRSRPAAVSLSRSMDLGCEGRKLINGSAKVVRALRESLLGEGSRTSSDEKVRRSLSRDETVKWVRDAHEASCVNSPSLGIESRISDTESVSSECNSGSHDINTSVARCGNKGGGVGGRGRSIVVPARVWEEANSRFKRTSEPGSPLAQNSSLKGLVPPKLIVPKKFVNDSPVASPRGAVNNRASSPTRRSVRPASPNKPRTCMASEISSTFGGVVNNRGFSSPIRGSMRPASPSKSRTFMGTEKSSTFGGTADNRGLLSPIRGSVRPASPSKARTSMGSEKSSTLRGDVDNRGLPSPIRGSVRPASPSKSRTSMGSEKSSTFGGSVNNRGFSSPIRGSVRPASPSKSRTSMGFEKSSPFRMSSPSRVRNGSVVALANSIPSTPSVLCFGADVRRVKVGDNRLGDAHLLRLLHNRHLQWRFVNARAEASSSIQKINSERNLYNVWKKMSDLHGAVSYKRKELQWLMQKLKLVSILKDQMIYLEEWDLMENDYCSSLSGAAESLEASVICLPLVGGARADIQDVKDAICSAADVMRAMASSICSLLAKVDEMNSLMAQVASITSKEHSLLNECKEILSALAAMQVKDCSLRAHMVQLKCTPSSLAVGA